MLLCYLCSWDARFEINAGQHLCASPCASPPLVLMLDFVYISSCTRTTPVWIASVLVRLMVVNETLLRFERNSLFVHHRFPSFCISLSDNGVPFVFASRHDVPLSFSFAANTISTPACVLHILCLLLHCFPQRPGSLFSVMTLDLKP
jgi:hypothetical protein